MKCHEVLLNYALWHLIIKYWHYLTMLILIPFLNVDDEFLGWKITNLSTTSTLKKMSAACPWVVSWCSLRSSFLVNQWKWWLIWTCSNLSIMLSITHTLISSTCTACLSHMHSKNQHWCCHKMRDNTDCPVSGMFDARYVKSPTTYLTFD